MLKAYCKAMSSFDAKQCPAGKKGADCSRYLKRNQLVAKSGLEVLLKEGSPQEKDLAAAALGKAEGCATALAEWKKSCVVGPEAPAAPKK